jgi:hypothetical protein
MKTKISQAIVGGIVATVAMSIFNMIAPVFGMPGLNAPAMLSMMMSTPMFLGWVMHFMIGIIFALIYAYLLLPMLKKIDSKVVKGIIFGVIAFIIGNIGVMILGAIFGDMPPPEEGMLPMMIESFLGHVLFGIMVALFVVTSEPAESR